MALPIHRQTCRVCGISAEVAGRMSWTGKCGDCGERVMLENARDISNHSGPGFERWRRGMAASVGAPLLDDPRHAE